MRSVCRVCVCGGGGGAGGVGGGVCVWGGQAALEEALPLARLLDPEPEAPLPSSLFSKSP